MSDVQVRNAAVMQQTLKELRVDIANLRDMCISQQAAIASLLERQNLLEQGLMQLRIKSMGRGPSA